MAPILSHARFNVAPCRRRTAHPYESRVEWLRDIEIAAEKRRKKKLDTERRRLEKKKRKESLTAAPDRDETKRARSANDDIGVAKANMDDCKQSHRDGHASNTTNSSTMDKTVECSNSRRYIEEGRRWYTKDWTRVDENSHYGGGGEKREFLENIVTELRQEGRLGPPVTQSQTLMMRRTLEADKYEQLRGLIGASCDVDDSAEGVVDEWFDLPIDSVALDHFFVWLPGQSDCFRQKLPDLSLAVVPPGYRAHFCSRVVYLESTESVLTE